MSYKFIFRWITYVTIRYYHIVYQKYRLGVCHYCNNKIIMDLLCLLYTIIFKIVSSDSYNKRFRSDMFLVSPKAIMVYVYIFKWFLRHCPTSRTLSSSRCVRMSPMMPPSISLLSWIRFASLIAKIAFTCPLSRSFPGSSIRSCLPISILSMEYSLLSDINVLSWWFR